VTYVLTPLKGDISSAPQPPGRPPGQPPPPQQLTPQQFLEDNQGNFSIMYTATQRVPGFLGQLCMCVCVVVVGGGCARRGAFHNLPPANWFPSTWGSLWEPGMVWC
jgi:hypothetical protein